MNEMQEHVVIKVSELELGCPEVGQTWLGARHNQGSQPPLPGRDEDEAITIGSASTFHPIF